MASMIIELQPGFELISGLTIELPSGLTEEDIQQLTQDAQNLQKHNYTAEEINEKILRTANDKQTIVNLTAKTEALNNKINELNTQTNTYQQQYIEALTKLGITENNLAQVQGSLDAVNKEIAAMKAELHELREFRNTQISINNSLCKEKTLEELIPIYEQVIKDRAEVYGIQTFLIDPENNRLFTVDKNQNREYLPDEDTVFSEVLKSGQAKFSNDVKEVSNTDLCGYVEPRFTNNYAVVPVISHDNKIIGVTLAYNKDGGFDEENIKKLDVIDYSKDTQSTENTKSPAFSVLYNIGIKMSELASGRDALTSLHKMDKGKAADFVLHKLRDRLEKRDKGEEDKDTYILYADIDKFKSFNDTYGHDVGDMVLRMVGQKLNSWAREDDYAIRLHGEEMILIVNAGRDVALRIANDFCKDVAETPIDIGNQTVNVTVSVGVAPVDSTFLIDQPDKNVRMNDEEIKNYLKAFEHKGIKPADTQLYGAKKYRNAVSIDNNVDYKENYISACAVRNDIMTMKPPYFADKDTEILSITVKNDEGYDCKISIKTTDDVAVEYNGEVYNKPSEFPQELRAAILQDTGGYEVVSGNNNTLEITKTVYNCQDDKNVVEIDRDVSYDNLDITQFNNLKELKQAMMAEAVDYISHGKETELENIKQPRNTERQVEQPSSPSVQDKNNGTIDNR